MLVEKLEDFLKPEGFKKQISKKQKQEAPSFRAG
jgi:hypothetical protein